MSFLSVQITGTGSFLPGPPVANEQIDTVLGPLDGVSLEVRRFIETVGPKMLKRGGIRARHFAVDPKTQDMTYNYSTLAEQAARNALEMAEAAPQELDLIVLSCPFYKYSTPPKSALLQERLGVQTCAEIEVHSNCTGVAKSVQIASQAVTAARCSL